MKRLSLNSKLAFIFAIFICSLLAVTFIGTSKISSLSVDLNDLLGSVAKKAILAESMSSKLNEIRNGEKSIILQKTPEGIKKDIARLEKLEDEFRKILDNYFSKTIFSNKSLQFSLAGRRSDIFI